MKKNVKRAANKKNVNTLKIDLEKISDSLYRSTKELPALNLLIMYLKIEKHMTLMAIADLFDMSHQTINNYLTRVYKCIRKNVK